MASGSLSPEFEAQAAKASNDLAIAEIPRGPAHAALLGGDNQRIVQRVAGGRQGDGVRVPSCSSIKLAGNVAGQFLSVSVMVRPCATNPGTSSLVAR